MNYRTVMKKFKFEGKGVYFSRIEEEDLFEVTKVGSKYVVRRGNGRESTVDTCSGLAELVPLLKDMLEYYDGSEYEQTYSIINTTTKHILTTQTSLERIKRYWHNIPRRKTSDLILVDDVTGEILKVKPKKG